jgi:hypothetical protein
VYRKGEVCVWRFWHDPRERKMASKPPFTIVGDLKKIRTDSLANDDLERYIHAILRSFLFFSSSFLSNKLSFHLIQGFASLPLHKCNKIYPQQGWSTRSSRLTLAVALIISKPLKYSATKSGIGAELHESTEHFCRWFALLLRIRRNPVSNLGLRPAIVTDSWVFSRCVSTQQSLFSRSLQFTADSDQCEEYYCTRFLWTYHSNKSH